MSEAKKVALPAYLPRRLQAFRIVKGNTTTYLLRDKLTDKTHDLEPWQFFVLEVLPGCETHRQAALGVRGPLRPPAHRGRGPEVLRLARRQKLLDEESAAHPLLEPFTKQSYALHPGWPSRSPSRSWRRHGASTSTPPGSAAVRAAGRRTEGSPGGRDAGRRRRTKPRTSTRAPPGGPGSCSRSSRCWRRCCRWCRR